MQLLRWIASVILVTALGAGFGLAASVSATSGSLGAGTTAVPRCTAAGLSVLQNLTGATVTSITIGVLPGTCGGATLQATVNNGAAQASGSAVVPAGGGSVTVPLSGAPSVAAADQVDLVVIGP